MKPYRDDVTLAVTGASGAPYALSLIKALLEADRGVHLMISDAARVVLATESELQLPAAPKTIKEKLSHFLQVPTEKLYVYTKDNWMSPVASGSSSPRSMVVCPCSTGTLAAIRSGTSDNLIERAADVVLKERGKLILVPRETPFSTIHLENCYQLSLAGAVILPAMPGFYHNPQSVDDLIHFVVARILEQLGISQSLIAPWGYSQNTNVS
ncbi:MAG: flavin prenyltransferase UbiX [Pseudomonadota bacterium]